MSAGLQILLAGIGTYMIRVSAIAVAGRFGDPSPTTEATMRLIGPSVLAAIVADRLLLRDGQFTVTPSWWIAAVISGAVAYRWRSAGLTMAVGMATVWILDAATG